MAEVIRKVDDMCESIFKHVSKNGLFVTLFTGPNTPPKPPIIESSEDDSDKSSKAEVVKTNGNSTVSEPISQEPSPITSSRTRQNGVCFIRINTQK